MNCSTLLRGKQLLNELNRVKWGVFVRIRRGKYRIILFSFFTLLCGFLATPSFAQTTITGKVTTQDTGETLPGVNIGIKGTSSGTTTDNNGNYSLQVTSQADSLVFSFVGYTSQIIGVNGKTTINVSLVPTTFTGQQLVVVGYGTQKKKTITSSISSVSSEDFQKGQVDNPVALIQGKVAGLSIVKNGGDPNAGYNIRLRGLSTIGANTQPLVVVDGIPGASLSTVDPNDIKSIDVLKDASASAIYGTRGSSGVIIITTKSGTKSPGKPTFNIEYNGSVTGSRPARMQNVLSHDQFTSLLNQLAQEDPDQYGSLPKSLDQGSSTNWYDHLLQTGVNTVHEIALSGGAQSTAYRASVNYRDVQGIERSTGFDELNGRLNITQYAINDNLTMHLDLTAQKNDQQLGFANAFRYATTYNPTAPVRDPSNTIDGGYYQNRLFDYYNPVAIIEQNTNKGKNSLVSGSLKADYDLSDYIPGLNVAAFYTQQLDQNSTRYYSPSNSYYSGEDRHGLARHYDESNINEDFNTTIHYEQTVLSNLDVDAVIGYDWQQFQYTNQNIEGGNFLTDTFGSDNLGAGQDFNNGIGTISSYKSIHKLIAYFGRINLDFQDTYFLTGSLRREGSSRFGANNKYALFPAINGGIELANLFQNQLSSLNSLKIRASFGITGNEPPGDYLSLQLFGPTGGSFLFNGNFIPSYGPTQNPNPNLQWEKKHELDIGLDFALLDSRLQGSIDWYSSKTKDLILNATVPVPPNFSSSEYINVGNLSNKGVEGSLSFNAVQHHDFSWTTSANVSFPKRTVLENLSNDQYSFGKTQIQNDLGSPGQNSTTLNLVKEGDPIGEIYGPVFDGVTADGDWKFKDLNGDGTIDKEDQTVIGNGLPTFMFGFKNAFHYKNWDLSFFIQGTFGHDLVNTYRAFYEDPAIVSLESYNVLQSSLSGPVSKISVAPKFSSYYVENASYAKLENLTIGYNIPFKANGPVQSFRIYISGNNLYTLTNYKGADPSVRYADSQNGAIAPNPLWPGIDRRDTWFTARQVTFGVDVKF